MGGSGGYDPYEDEQVQKDIKSFESRHYSWKLEFALWDFEAEIGKIVQEKLDEINRSTIKDPDKWETDVWEYIRNNGSEAWHIIESNEKLYNDILSKWLQLING